MNDNLGNLSSWKNIVLSERFSTFQTIFVMAVQSVNSEWLLIRKRLLIPLPFCADSEGKIRIEGNRIPWYSIENYIILCYCKRAGDCPSIYYRSAQSYRYQVRRWIFVDGRRRRNIISHPRKIFKKLEKKDIVEKMLPILQTNTDWAGRGK